MTEKIYIIEHRPKRGNYWFTDRLAWYNYEQGINRLIQEQNLDNCCEWRLVEYREPKVVEVPMPTETTSATLSEKPV